jgi:outer membrane cobalamin receptor
VPGTWIQSIDVGKGAGSVVNGYESMTGQINLEFKKPEIGEKLYLNAYINSFGRTELNANTRYELNEKWSSALLVHADYLASEIDNNDDGFMDLPKSRQFNILNRYKFESEKLVSQIGINFMSDQKAGGQLGFGFGDDHEMSPEYGYANQVNRLEIFGKTGLLFPTTPYKGWGFIYSVSYNEVNSGFGRNTYSGNEKTGYLNVINQNIIGNTFHQYKTGASFLYDEFEESYNDSSFQRTEIVPGAYFEYSFLPTDDFTLVAGGRVDYNSVYGTFWSPRIHTRYQFDQKNTLRVAAGKGYRVPNPFIEGNNFLFSSRNVIVSEAPNPEESLNLGTSLVSEQKLGERNFTLIFDYFYTNFQNQLIYDLDQNSRELNIYNLNGNSRSHSLQIESKS